MIDFAEVDQRPATVPPMTGMLSDRVRNPGSAGVRRRFLLASLIGGAAALVLFAIVMQGGRDGLLGTDLLGNFYDGQARALFDGHLDVDPSVPGFEGFRIGDKTFIYQGLTPTILRLPILGLTHSLDGRLTGLSMLVAFGVTMTYIAAASWQIRVLLRSYAPIGRAEFVLSAVATFGIGTGSILFLASRAWVYHEAQLWGVALSLGSLVHLTYWLTSVHQSDDTPDRDIGEGGASRLAWMNLLASVMLAGLALNTRSSIALGPFAALAIVGVLLIAGMAAAKVDDHSFAGRLIRRLFVTTGWKPRRSARQGLAALAILVLGLSAGLGSYATVNYARFGSAFGVPLDRQMLVENDLARREALDANDGSLFGLQFAPSVALQLLRPDALATRSAFPYLGFPENRPSVIGSAVFAERDWSSSVPASEPLLFLGALVGLVVLAAPRRLVDRTLTGNIAIRDRWAGDAASGDLAADRHVSTRHVAALRIPVVGAAAGAAAILVFGYMAERYVSDLYPFLALATLVALHGLSQRFGTRRPRAGTRDYKALTLAVVLTTTSIWGAWANTAVALQYQREIAPGFTSVGRGSWLGLQLAVPGSVPHIRVGSVDALPELGPRGTVAVIGDCAALYRSSGDAWYPVESGDSGGSTRVRIRSDSELASPISIATAQGDRVPVEISLVPISGGKARLKLTGPQGVEGVGFDLDSGRRGGFELDLDLVHDRANQTIIAVQHGQTHELLRTVVALGDLKVTAAGNGPVRVSASPLPTPLCRKLTSR